MSGENGATTSAADVISHATGDSGTDSTATGSPVSEPPATRTPDPSQDMDYARGWNALTKREKMLTDRERALKEQSAKYQEYEGALDLIKTDPVAFLEKNGWNFNQLADFMMNDRKVSPENQIQKLQSRLDEFENQRRREIEERETRESRQKAEETVNNYKSKIKNEITEASEEFELINAFGEFDTVYDVIEEEYNRSGKILDVKEAAKWVEKYLEDQSEKLYATKKFKTKYNLMDAIAEKEQKEELPPRVRESETPHRTLTNLDAARTVPPRTEENRWLSDEESKRKAADFLRESFARKKGLVR